MARKLKVYAVEIDGLNDWIVAAPNRPAALAAFDVHQDLFAQGLAREETAPALVAQAIQAPGPPLRRPKGSKAPFKPAGKEADWSAAAPKGRKRKPAPDRGKLERAEADLTGVEERHRQAEGDFRAKQDRLDARRQEEAAQYDREKAQAQAAVDKARRAYDRSARR